MDRTLRIDSRGAGAQHAAVRADVFGASGHPQMLLRIGWAPINADPLPPTPRRHLSDVVECPAASTVDE